MGEFLQEGLSGAFGDVEECDSFGVAVEEDDVEVVIVYGCYIIDMKPYPCRELLIHRYYVDEAQVMSQLVEAYLVHVVYALPSLDLEAQQGVLLLLVPEVEHNVDELVVFGGVSLAEVFLEL